MTTSKENKKILVSVALATYNGEKFLRKQLDSLLGQSYENIEIVISDDGSKDQTHEILEEYSRKDPRIKWDIHPKPDGLIKNFERAIGRSQGEIIFLCDQDDVWYEDKIAKHVEVYNDRAIAWVYNRVVLVDEEGKEIGHLEDTAPDYYREKTALENTWGSCILGCATSYRAPLLHAVMPIGSYAPAHDSWIQLALYPKQSHCIQDILQAYRLHGNNNAGWNKEPTSEREQLAIANNMRYLKHLPYNKNLNLGKRLFFFFVYLAKVVRASVRSNMLSL